ncbi:DUF975 family protein [Anaerotignum sp.]
MKLAADFRREAREALRGKWFIAVLVGLAAAVLGATGNGFGFNFETNGDMKQVNVTFADATIYSAGTTRPDSMASEYFLTGAVSYVLVIALVLMVVHFILGSIVTVGYAKFNLDLVDGEEGKAGTLFDYFPHWKTMVKAWLLQSIYILGWTLLFIIPGIVAAYRYAMTSCILAENPEMTASEAIDRSKELMDGNKWRLFCLNFSFIGWSILCGFTLGIGNLWLTPYEQAANAAFYRDITRPLAGEEHEIYLQETVLSE